MPHLASEENVTLPIGPAEESEWWWATARQGFTTLGFFISYLGEDGTHKLEYVFYVSKILDHTSLFAALALRDLLTRYDFGNDRYHTVQAWSDCGPHFRSYMFLWELVRILKDYSFANVYMNYYGEHHGKGRCDGAFGLQSRWIADYSREHVISTLENLLTAMRVGAADTMNSDPGGPRYIIVEWLPEKPLLNHTLNQKSTTLLIEYTYCLHITRALQAHGAAIYDFVYNDRIGIPGAGRHVGCIEPCVYDAGGEEWRFSYRKTVPESAPLQAALLRRRLDKQRHAKVGNLMKTPPHPSGSFTKRSAGLRLGSGADFSVYFRVERPPARAQLAV
jgi:hypothetical protein